MKTRFDKAKTALLSHQELGNRHLAIFGSIARNEWNSDEDEKAYKDL